VAFDFETTFTDPVDPTTPNDERRKHEVNFIAAWVTCPECIENGQWRENLADKIDGCEFCGENRTITFGHCDYSKTSTDFHLVTPHPIVEFVKWILYELPFNCPTYAFAHNGGRFDFMFICRELYMEKLNPDMIRKGNKLYQLKVKARPNLNPKVVFKDSFNLFNMPLANLVPSFELQVSDKPFFPYLANRLKIIKNIKNNYNN
jgi:hypothetical protein